jgi:hypothetical protein
MKLYAPTQRTSGMKIVFGKRLNQNNLAPPTAHVTTTTGGD